MVDRYLIKILGSSTAYEEEEEAIESLNESVEFLISFWQETTATASDENLKMLFLNEDLFESIKIISDNLSKQQLKKDHLNVFLEKEAVIDVFCVLLDVSYEPICKLINRRGSSSSSGDRKNSTAAAVELEIYFHLNTLIKLIWCLTNFMVKFRLKFHAKNGTKYLLRYLSDHKLLRSFLTNNDKENRSNSSILDLSSFFSAILGTLHNISKSIKIDLNATNILVSFAHLMNELDRGSTCTINAYMTLSNILTDKDIDELQDINEIVQNLVDLIGIAARSIEAGNPSRTEIELENGEIQEVCMVRIEERTEFDIVELISSIYHIAVNDKIKHFIYFDCNIKNYIEDIVEHGNQVEKENALRLLYQLSFDRNVALSIQSENKLIRLIKEQSIIEHNNPNFNKYCKGILFVIGTILTHHHPHPTIKKFSSNPILGGMEANETNETTQPHPSPNPLPKNHSVISLMNQQQQQQLERKRQQPPQIMISYNSASREICMKIKAELEKLGFKIWIDVESIHGSSIESMANAIETSDCILVCMTERYKVSPNCRAEAEYTFNIGKPFIPLKLQQNYKPDGWLGFIMGAKIFIDFVKYPFEISFGRLKHELKEIIKWDFDSNSFISTPEDGSKTPTPTPTLPVPSSTNVPKPTPPTPTPQIPIPPTKRSASDWTNDEVKKWLLDEIKLNDLNEDLEKFDGKMLEELARIQKQSIDTFIKLLIELSSSELTIFEIVQFSKELRKLFI